MRRTRSRSSIEPTAATEAPVTAGGPAQRTRAAHKRRASSVASEAVESHSSSHLSIPGPSDRDTTPQPKQAKRQRRSINVQEATKSATITVEAEVQSKRVSVLGDLTPPTSSPYQQPAKQQTGVIKYIRGLLTPDSSQKVITESQELLRDSSDSTPVPGPVARIRGIHDEQLLEDHRRKLEHHQVIEREFNELTDRIDKLEQHTVLLDDELDKRTKTIVNLQTCLGNSENNVVTALAQRDEFRAERDQARVECDEARGLNEQLRAELDESRNQLDRAEAEIQRLEGQHEEYVSLVAEIQQEGAQKDQMIARLRALVQSLRDRHEAALDSWYEEDFAAVDVEVTTEE